MVEIVDAQKGSLIVTSCDLVTPRELFEQLTSDHPQGSLFLLTPEGCEVPCLSEALTPGLYFLFCKSHFAVDTSAVLSTPKTLDRCDLPTGDIFDESVDLGNDRGWIAAAEKRSFALQEDAIAKYTEFMSAAARVREGLKTVEWWTLAGVAVMRRVERFVSDCEGTTKALLKRLENLPPHTASDTFHADLCSLEASTNPTKSSLAKVLLQQRVPKAYSLLHHKLTAQLTHLQLTLDFLLTQKVHSVIEKLENARDTAEWKLETGLKASEKEQAVQEVMRETVMQYSQLRDAIEANQDSEQARIDDSAQDLQCRLAEVDSTLLGLKAAVDSLPEEVARVTLFLRMAVDSAAYVTAKLKVQCTAKLARVESRLATLARISAFFEIPLQIEEICREIEAEKQRRDLFRTKSEEVKRQWVELTTHERMQRADFHSRLGGYLPSGLFPFEEIPETLSHAFDSLPSDSSTSVYTSVISSLTAQNAALERELQTLRKAVYSESVKQRLAQADMKNVEVESRLLLAPALSVQRDEIREEVQLMKENQRLELLRLKKTQEE